jgi:glycerol-3-phosphate dehydrogenase subunit C
MNAANRNRFSRIAMEKTLGIHRDWIQPSFHRETVKRWFAKERVRPEGENGHVVLFTTCSVNYNDPDTGRAAVEILERSGVRVDLCYERCCGMPFTDTGDLDAARRNAEKNVADLLPYVEAGATVVAPGPSCSLMLKTEYPKLLANEGAERVAAGTQDLMEFIYNLARAKKLDRDFKSSLGRVAYHAPCHLRAQNIGFRSRDLLQLAADEVVLVDACSGVDGTWGMQERFYDESMKVASGMLKRLDAAKPDWVSTDCPLAALRIQKGLGVKALHPVILLNRAYQESAP